MTNLTPVEKGLTPSQIAKQEIAAEKTKKAVKLLKDKYRELDTAQTVVDNIEREVADLEVQIDQGNI